MSTNHHNDQRRANCVTIIAVAGGRGQRFLASGGKTNKLDALLCGQPVLWHVMEAVRASALDWRLVRPAQPTQGMGQSISMGVKLAPQASGWLILPCDLPLVTSDSIGRVADALADHSLVVPNYHGRRGHPVGFGRECFSALCALNCHEGAQSVVHHFRQRGTVLDLPLEDCGICVDVDTQEDLRRAAKLMGWRQLSRAQTWTQK